MQSIRALFFTGLTFFVHLLYAKTGQLQLITHNFEHPQLKTWAIENVNLLGGLQKGVDFMRLNEGDELRLVQSADSLSQAHGFLSFDYRIYGLTASYTAETAQQLLPKIRMEIQNKFNLGSNLPYVLMISWFQHQSNQADMLLYIQWNGFTRLVDYDETRRSLIESLTKDAHSATQATNPFSPQLAMATTLSKFRILLTPVLIGYFIVEGQKYTANDTLFTCQCGTAIKLAAFRSNNLPYTKTGKQKWNNETKYLFNNIGELDRTKASPNSGTVIQAEFTDSVGVQYTAILRVFVVDVDFADANGRFSFDDNEVKKYSSFKKDENGDIIRGKNIPKSFSDNVVVQITPRSVAHKVYFSTSASTVNPNRATSARQIVNISHRGNTYMDNLVTHVGSDTGCDYGKLSLLHPDSITLRIKIIWASDNANYILNPGQITGQLFGEVSRIFERVGIYIAPRSVESVIINYDLDHDSLLLRPSKKEMGQLVNKYNANQSIFSNKVIPGSNVIGVFFVHGLVQDPNSDSVAGVALLGANALALPAGFRGGARTLAHEIGHAAFSFLETIEITPQGTDSDNLMSYLTTGSMLRIFQWEQIQLAINGMSRN